MNNKDWIGGNIGAATNRLLCRVRRLHLQNIWVERQTSLCVVMGALSDLSELS